MVFSRATILSFQALYQKKKENWFSLNENGIMSSFVRATILSFHPVRKEKRIIGFH